MFAWSGSGADLNQYGVKAGQRYDDRRTQGKGGVYIIMRDQLVIHTHKVKFDTAPELYGLFFEDINRAADGGLYPEMIRNRAFEDSLDPEGCTVDENRKIFVNPYGWPGAFNHGEGMDEWAAAVEETEIPGWYVRNASWRLLTSATLNSNRKAALEVTFAPGGMLYNIGYCGVPVKKGEAYQFYFWGKAQTAATLRVSLASEEGVCLGSAELSLEPGDAYQRYDCALTALQTDYRGRLVLESDRELTLVLGFTSLMPAKTFCGHGLREDLALALKNTHAQFIRFPGGCVVEGINEQNALRFSRTIGPVWERPGAQLMWHYRTTNGLGFHEYLQLCEDLGMEAMYVANCGMSCQARHGCGFSEEVTREYLEEARHALEYALGGEDTPYGSLRAKYGHREPFRLKYMEIGNENFGPEYDARYQLFYETLKKEYPQVLFISNSHTERQGLPTEYADEHYYDAPEFFLENTDLFDDYDRKGPKIFVGEYAVNGGNTIASMECALAEAAFLLGIENNQDIVKLTAYAPLFQNSDYTAWKPNLIVFNNHQVYGIPSYHAISLLGKYRGDQVVELGHSGSTKPPVYRGLPGLLCEKEGLLFRNVRVNGTAAEVSRCIYGTVREENGVYRMTDGGEPHRCTGKSREWNDAFETFLANRGFQEKPVYWAVFGQEELEEYTFEVEIKAEPDNSITLSIWNHHPETDAGCNEPRDVQWNLRSVRNQVWRIEDGVGATRTPRFFDKPLAKEETATIPVRYGEYNQFKIVCDHFGYSCYINGELVQERKHVLHPLVHASASQERERVYLKLVNTDEEAHSVQIHVDCAVEERGIAEVLAAALESTNSFEEPQCVSAREMEITAGEEFTYLAPAHSVNVLVLRKK